MEGCQVGVGDVYVKARSRVVVVVTMRRRGLSVDDFRGGDGATLMRLGKTTELLKKDRKKWEGMEERPRLVILRFV